MRCPVCKAKLNVVVKKLSLEKGELKIGIFWEDSLENILHTLLLKYWRWCTEGKKEYRKEQFYYDNVRDYIKYLPEENAYEFDIQVKDYWVKGKFIIEQGKIKILGKTTVPLET